MKKLIIIIMAIAVIIIIGIIIFLNNHQCIKSHTEMVHHPAWTQSVITSFKPMISVQIFHPAHDSLDEICDERN